MESKRHRICILGVTVSGNKGGEAMLYSIMHNMERLAGPCVYDLISVYPAQDRRRRLPANLRIVAGKALTMLGFVLPVTLVAWPLRRLAIVRRCVGGLPVFRSIRRADVVIDCSGIAFMDGRGAALLLYNLSLCLPAVLLGRPIIKVAQALGPFERSLNRCCARLALRRMDRVIARGATTGEHLRQLGLTNYEVCADTAFVMPVGAAATAEAVDILRAAASGRDLVGLSPSTVVDDACRGRGVDYAGILARFAEDLVEQGYGVVLIPHSIRPLATTRKNNDILVCRAVIERMKSDRHVLLVDRDLDAGALRALIGRMRFCVVSRFHAMVSALAVKTPLLLIGWSHKYREVMRMFDLEDLAMGYEELSPAALADRFARLVAAEAAVRAKLEDRLPAAEAGAMRNFERAVELMRGGDSGGRANCE
jgi:polysaccharide pyruvyl transferase WcaK-like protein